MKKFFASIGEFFQNLWSSILDWYRKSTFGAIIQKIGWFIGFAFWPLKWIKERTFDRLRFDIQKKIVSFVFLAPVVIGFLVFFLYPMIMSLIYSFSSVTLSGKGLEVILNKGDLLKNYKYALTIDADYPVELWSTLGTTVSDCAVVTIFSLLIAVMLNGEFRGRALVRAIFFLPVIFNSEAVTAALKTASNMTNAMSSEGKSALSALFDMQMFMQGIGIPKFLITFLSGITESIYTTISYSGIQILIFLTAIQSVPKHLYEAARMEGATSYEMFWKITLPMVSNMVPTVIVYTVVDSYLRSKVNTILSDYQLNSKYDIHAAMSWIYLGVMALFLGIVLAILSKVVFYYDDRK